MGAWSDGWRGQGYGDRDKAMEAPTILPTTCCPSRLACVTRGALSPWETSGRGWPTAGKPCVGTAGEEGGHMGTSSGTGVLLTTVARQLGTSRLNPLPRSEPVGSAGSVSTPCGRMEMR